MIVRLYDRLMLIAPSPVVSLNRAVAVGERDGAEHGLAALRAIDDRERLSAYPFYYAAIAEFELRCGNRPAATAHCRDALRVARNVAERRLYGSWRAPGKRSSVQECIVGASPSRPVYPTAARFGIGFEHPPILEICMKPSCGTLVWQSRGFAHSFILIAALAGCGRDRSASKDAPALGDASAGGVAQVASRSVMSSAPATEAAATAPPNIAPDQLPNSAQANVAAGTMVIRNGAVAIEVDSLELAIAAVHQVATSMGGSIGNSSQSSGAYNVRTATIELKIPSARYDNALRNLQPIGKVESETSTAEDVGEEFFDITARQANARRLEERLITLLATRTGKLEDVLMVERELARVREEIERYEGRLRYLASHVATSTLAVTVHEKRAIASQAPGRNVIVESFKDAWRIFVSLVSVAIASLGWIIPLAALAGVGYVVRRRLISKK